MEFIRENLLLIIIVAVLALVLLWVVATYNALVKARNKVGDQWAQVDVHLKRRFDLIPNLVETVKGYAKHESETLEAVILARNQAAGAKTPNDEIMANDLLTGALGKLFALAENYPNLKADRSFADLHKDLRETEDKIAFARQFYNDSVYLYKNRIESFPTILIAGMLGFKPKEFFTIADAEKDSVKVDFSK